jgi:hypothetical protein
MSFNKHVVMIAMVWVLTPLFLYWCFISFVGGGYMTITIKTPLAALSPETMETIRSWREDRIYFGCPNGTIPIFEGACSSICPYNTDPKDASACETVPQTIGMSFDNRFKADLFRLKVGPLMEGLGLDYSVKTVTNW